MFFFPLCLFEKKADHINGKSYAKYNAVSRVSTFLCAKGLDAVKQH